MTKKTTDIICRDEETPEVELPDLPDHTPDDFKVFRNGAVYSYKYRKIVKAPLPQYRFFSASKENARLAHNIRYQKQAEALAEAAVLAGTRLKLRNKTGHDAMVKIIANMMELAATEKSRQAVEAARMILQMGGYLNQAKEEAKTNIQINNIMGNEAAINVIRDAVERLTRVMNDNNEDIDVIDIEAEDINRS